MNVYLTYIAIFFLLISAIYLSFQKSRSPGWLLLTLGLLTIAAIEFGDLQALLHSSDWIFWKHFTLIAESSLPAIFLSFSTQAYREGGFRSASLSWWGLLFL